MAMLTEQLCAGGRAKDATEKSVRNNEINDVKYFGILGGDFKLAANGKQPLAIE